MEAVVFVPQLYYFFAGILRSASEDTEWLERSCRAEGLWIWKILQNLETECTSSQWSLIRVTENQDVQKHVLFLCASDLKNVLEKRSEGRTCCIREERRSGNFMKKISKYLLEKWYVYAFAVACLIIKVSLDMLSPQITKSMIDDVIGKGQKEIFPMLLLGVLLIGVGRCIFGYLQEFTFDRVGSEIAMDIRRRLFDHIQSLSMRYFNNTNTGELMSRVKDDVDKIWGSLTYISMLIVEVIFHTSVILICMYRLDKGLFLIPVIAMPLVALLAILMEQKLGTVYEEISEENAALNTVAEENLAGVRTVKAFAREKFEIRKFLSHNQRYYELNMKQSKVLVRYQPLFQAITKLLPVIVIIFGGYRVIEGKITLGTLGAFVEYSMNIVWPMEMLGWLFNDFAAAVASNEKLKKIYRQVTEIREAKNPDSLTEVKGNVTFDHVSLDIDGHPILKDISFELPAGKTLGIMGETGAGKTSVIHVLQRFYDVTGGKILLDGKDIRTLPLQKLRRSISLVMQDVFLFSDTVEENVRFGKRGEVPQEEVIASLDCAEARNFVERMESQYDTLIGERGVGLSGGQKQRISIARALAKHAPVLVLDDSTSALDMDTERQIQKNLRAVKDVTKIIIGHRVSSVRDADEILILQDGRVAERGTHETLWKQKGIYYQTCQIQGEVI